MVRESTPPFLLHSTSSIFDYGMHDVNGSNRESLDIKHGILPSYTVRLQGRLNTVLYYPRKQSYTVLHSQFAHHYTKQELIEELPLNAGGKEIEIERLVHAAEYDVYVGVCKYRMILFNSSFQCLYQVECVEPTSTSGFNSWSGQLITAGVGYFKTWVFRKGAKELAPSITYTDGLLPNENITNLHLEAVPGKSQRVFVSIGCSLKVFLLETGRLKEHLKDIHRRPISAVMFFRPLRLLITAARDGSIKVWDSARNLCCTFVGHNGVVTDLVPYPYGPMVVSSSLDCTLRVWDITSYEQVQLIDHILPVEGVFCEPGIFQILTYSSKQIKVWLVQQLYSQITHVRRSSLSLLSTSHHLVPTRVLAACADSVVRMVSPLSGDVLTSALLPVERQVLAICYFSFQEILYVLDDEGSISVFDTTENPAMFKTCWSPPKALGKYCCLAVYETCMDEEEIGEIIESDHWLAVLLEGQSLSHHTMTEKDILRTFREGESFLLVGTSRGFLTILDPSTGDVICSLHGETGISSGDVEDEDKVGEDEEKMVEDENEVLMIACNNGNGQVITAGRAAMVYIWEFHPNVKEALGLVFSFPLTHPPSFMVSSRDRLAVACNDEETATYAIHLFNIAERETYSASPESSHCEPILDLDVAHKMKLFASCSLDCTIRIWTEDNILVRVLCLGRPAEGLVFCSLQADIIIAIHSHLHIINNLTYFTKTLYKQMMSTRLPEPVIEKQLPWNEKFPSLPPQDLDRLNLVDTIILESSYQGELLEEEMEAIAKKAYLKTLALEKISNRKKEILAIADGLLLSKKDQMALGPLIGKDKEEMWNALLLKVRPEETRLSITLPPDINFDLDDSDTDGRRDFSPFIKGTCSKFFPPLATFQPPYPVAPDGCLPNSVLLQKLRKTDADLELSKNWIPPWTSGIQQIKQEQEEEKMEVTIVEESVSEGTTLMERLQVALAMDIPSSSASIISSFTSPPTSPLPHSPPRGAVTTLRQLPKLVLPERSLPKLLSPTPSVTPSLPSAPISPPLTPLPEYIAQFIGQSWFDTLFPNVNSKTFPKPWTQSSFILKLLSFLPSSSVAIHIKTAILQAILQLLVTTPTPYILRAIYNAILDLLLDTPMPSTTVPTQRPMVLAAMSLLFHLDFVDYQLACLLLYHYVEGDPAMCTLVMDYLVKHGMVDPRHYFQSAMECVKKKYSILSGTDLEIKGDEGKEEKGEEVEEEEKQKVAVREMEDKMKEQIFTVPTAVDRAPDELLLSLVNEWMESWSEEFTWATHKSAATKKSSKKALKMPTSSTSSLVQPSSKKVCFIKEDAPPSPDSSLINIHPISIINYYIEQEHAKEMAKKKSHMLLSLEPEEKEDLPLGNTVTRLPHINKSGLLLTRLGETHRSCCHPERESSFPLLLRQHPHHHHLCYKSEPTCHSRLWNQFSHCLTLALTPQNINPFLSEEEKAEEKQINLQKHRSFISDSRYFIHRNSYLTTSNEDD